MNRLVPLVIVVLLALLPASAPAAGRQAATAKKEISHLLAHIAQSDCRFIRNGTSYDSGEALQHIERKFGHEKAAARSAEEFIERAASRSSITGRPYRVICDGHEMNSSAWLTAELERYRAGPTVAAPVDQRK